MDYQMMQLDEMNPSPYNPRKTLKPGEQKYEALKESISRFDLVEPIIFNQKTGNIVGGHQRYNVLRDMGITSTLAVVVDLDEDKEKLLNVALNKIEGDWDYEKLKEMLQGRFVRSSFRKWTRLHTTRESNSHLICRNFKGLQTAWRCSEM